MKHYESQLVDRVGHWSGPGRLLGQTAFATAVVARGTYCDGMYRTSDRSL